MNDYTFRFRLAQVKRKLSETLFIQINFFNFIIIL